MLKGADRWQQLTPDQRQQVKQKHRRWKQKIPGTTHKHPAAFRSVQGSATRETTTVKKKIAMV
ncbi:MAG: hypothetical protein IIB73_10520 [Proteobacteria bacterium]|nr:hypothetical protein [Pseudomonadota bacterium]